MKYILALFILTITTESFAQEPQDITFDDGTVVKLTFHYDDPNRMYDYSISASFAELYFDKPSVGVMLVPSYNYSEKLNFDCGLFIPIADGTTVRMEPALKAVSKPVFEFFPEAHYQIKSMIYSEPKNQQVRFDRGIELNTNYIAKIAVKYKKEVFLDGGLNYTQFTRVNQFQTDGEEHYTLYGQSIFALSAGISRVKTNNYKLSMDERTRVYAKSSKFGFRLLFGVPLSSNIVRSFESSDLIEVDPLDGFEKPKFLPVGARFSFDKKHPFAKTPNVFISWGVNMGINPAYGGFEILDVEVPIGVGYFGARLGLGFGKFTK